MKLVNGIYESDTAFDTPHWLSLERGVKKGEIRVIAGLLFYAEYITLGDKPWEKPRIRWEPITKEMIHLSGADFRDKI